MRSKVLSTYRLLHRVRKQVFKEDEYALAAGRLKINEEFRRHKDEKDETKIAELVKVGEEAAFFLKKGVIQGKLNESGNYEVKITKDTVLLDNKLFSEESATKAEQDFKTRRKKSSKNKNKT